LKSRGLKKFIDFVVVANERPENWFIIFVFFLLQFWILALLRKKKFKFSLFISHVKSTVKSIDTFISDIV
jgi:hypothetical protein